MHLDFYDNNFNLFVYLKFCLKRSNLELNSKNKIQNLQKITNFFTLLKKIKLVNIIIIESLKNIHP